MLVEKVVAPPLDNNAYLVIDEKSLQAAVIDPALPGDPLVPARPSSCGQTGPAVEGRFGNQSGGTDPTDPPYARTHGRERLFLCAVGGSPIHGRYTVCGVPRPHRHVWRESREDGVQPTPPQRASANDAPVSRPRSRDDPRG